MERTLNTRQQPSQTTRAIFTIDCNTGKIISVAPIVDTDEQLDQLDSWIDACVVMAGLIRPVKLKDARTAAADRLKSQVRALG